MELQTIHWITRYSKSKQLLKRHEMQQLDNEILLVSVRAALFNSSMNHTDAPDWLSRCCGDEINRWTNKSTPFTACEVTIFIATSNFEIRNSLGYNISVENACLNYRTTNICHFVNKNCLKLHFYNYFNEKTHLSSATPKVGVSLCLLFLVHRRAEPGWIGESPVKDWWI